MILENLNFLTLIIFVPLLVLVGILGFITPVDKKVISVEQPYNIFHIVCGVIGALVLMSNHDLAIKSFNVVFGLVNLYQLIASLSHRFPVRHFQWTRADNIAHGVLAGLFLAVGFLGE